MNRFVSNVTQSWIGKISVFILIALGYFLLGSLSLKLATINDNASPLWPPAGFAIGCLMLAGVRFAPAIFLGAMLTNTLVSPVLTGPIIIGIGNMLEAVAGFYLVSAMLKKNLVKNYTEFYAILFGAAFASFISATVATTYLYVAQVIPISEIDYAWYTWWSGDTIGILITLPFFLEFFKQTNRPKISPRRLLIGLLTTIFLFGVIFLVFVKGYNLAWAWVLTPVLIVVGFSFGHLISRSILILLALFVVVLTTLGYSPYDYGNLNLNLIYAQSLLTSYAFAILFVRAFDDGFHISWKFVLGNAIAWTVLTSIIYVTFKYERIYAKEDLEKTIASAFESLEQSKQQSETLVRSASSLVTSNPEITGLEWKNFVRSLNFDLRQTEIQGLGIIFPSQKEDKKNVLKSLSTRGSPIKEIRLFDPEFSKKFSDQFVIGFVEPDLNAYAIGYDLGSHPERREAAEASRKKQMITASKVLELIQVKRTGFLMFNPISDSQKRFVGWIYAPVDVNLFFDRALRDYSRVLRVKIYDEKKLVYSLDDYPKDVFKNHSFKVAKNFNLFGNSLEIMLYPTAQFFTRHSGYSAVLALLMNLFMLFVAGFLLEQMSFGQRAEAMVDERTRELEESKMQLVHSSKMASLGEMASGMAHEINNPLTIILGKIKVISLLLKEGKVENPMVFEEIMKIQTTTERIGKIVKGLRSFARDSDLDPFEKVLVKTVVQETLDLCHEKFKAKGIHLTLKDIPPVLLNCRPSQISQVLLNILNNASDALESAPKGSKKEIVVNFEIKSENRIHIAISDTGKGIDHLIADKIMEPFFTTKEVGKGTGLGLSIAKGIIDHHGGKIWLDKESKQTKFVIELPYQRV